MEGSEVVEVTVDRELGGGRVGGGSGGEGDEEVGERSVEAVVHTGCEGVDGAGDWAREQGRGGVCEGEDGGIGLVGGGRAALVSEREGAPVQFDAVELERAS